MVEFIQSLIAAATVPAVDAVGAQETTPEINAEFEALFFSFNLPRSAASATPQTLRNAARDGADALSADVDETAFARPDVPLPTATATAGLETEMRSIDDAKGKTATPGASDSIFVRPTKTTNTELIGALPIERIGQNDRHQATTTPAESYTSNPEVAEPPVAPAKSHGVVVDAVPTIARAGEGAVEAKGGADKGATKNEAPAEPAARSAPGGTMTAPPADNTDGAPAPVDSVPAATAFAGDKPLRSIASPAAPINAEPARPPHFVIVSSAETRDGRIELRLDPPDLGSVHIDVSRDETGLIKAVISTERAETLDVARRHADVFKAELQRLGLGDVDLQFADRGETGASPDQRDRPRRSWTAAPEFNANFDRASFVEFDGGRFDVVA
jgi:hypothetical protein